MHGLSIFQEYDTQVSSFGLFYPAPHSDPAIGLYFGLRGMANYLFNPLIFDHRTVGKLATKLEISRQFHVRPLGAGSCFVLVDAPCPPI